MAVAVSYGDDFCATEIVLASPGVAGFAPVTAHIIAVGAAFESSALVVRFLKGYWGTLGAFRFAKEAFAAFLAFVWPQTHLAVRETVCALFFLALNFREKYELALVVFDEKEGVAMYAYVISAALQTMRDFALVLYFKKYWLTDAIQTLSKLLLPRGQQI